MSTIRKSTHIAVKPAKGPAKKKAKASSYHSDAEEEPEALDRAAELLQNGDIPTEDERAHFTDLLNTKSAELQAKRLEINRLEAEAASLERETADYARILSTMRVIPVEVLLQIFLLSIPADCAHHNAHNPNDIYDSLDPETAPQWVFTQVSKLWRTIALSCTALWAQVSIVLTPDMKTAAGVRKVAPILKLQLSRSMKAPLFVSIDASAFALSYSNRTQTLVSFLNTLCDTSSRWESFFYDIRRDYAHHILPGQVPVKLKSLYAVCRTETTPWAREFSIFKGITSISHFGGSIAALKDHPFGRSNLVEFSELPHRYKQGGSSAEVDALLQLPHLRKMTLVISPSRRLFKSLDKEGTFRALTHLTIATDKRGTGNVALLLRGLKFPELKYLSFPHESDPDLYATDFLALTTLLSESNVNLEKVCITFQEFGHRFGTPAVESNPSAFIRFLASQPMAKVENLSLINVYAAFSSVLLNKLVEESMSDASTPTFSFLPSLRRLEMHQESRYSIPLMQDVQERRQISVLQSLEPEKKEPKLSNAKKPVKSKPKKRKRKVESSDEEDSSSDYDSDYDD